MLFLCEWLPGFARPLLAEPITLNGPVSSEEEAARNRIKEIYQSGEALIEKNPKDIEGYFRIWQVQLSIDDLNGFFATVNLAVRNGVPEMQVYSIVSALLYEFRKVSLALFYLESFERAYYADLDPSKS